MRGKKLVLLAFLLMVFYGCQTNQAKINTTTKTDSSSQTTVVKKETTVKPTETETVKTKESSNDGPQRNSFTRPKAKVNYFDDGEEETPKKAVSDDEEEEDSDSDDDSEASGNLEADSLKRDLEMIRLKVKKIQYIYKKSMEDKVKENEKLKKEIEKMKLKIERMKEIYREKLGEDFE